MDVTNQVREARTRRGLSAVELAERVGVSRQTIHAIESGAYAPNTTVALKLARELGVGVEDLFQLEGAQAPTHVEAALVGGTAYPGAPLRVGRVGERLVAAPWSPEAFALPLADAVAASEAAAAQCGPTCSPRARQRRPPVAGRLRSGVVVTG